MKPKVILSRRVNYVLEACHLLESVAEMKEEKKLYDFRGIQKTLSQKFGICSEQSDKNIEFAEKLVLHASEVLKDDMPLVQKYFMPEADLSSMAHWVCGLNMTLPGEDSRDNGAGVLADYKEMTEQERDACFLEAVDESMDEEQLYALIGCSKRKIEFTDAERIRNVLSYVQKMELRPEQKTKLQDAYLNRDIYVEDAAGLLDKAITILKEHETEILSITEAWENYWSDFGDSEELQHMIDGMLGQMDLEELWITPGIMRGAWLQIGVKVESFSYKRGVPALWRVGVNLTKEFLGQTSGEVKEEYQPEEYQRILKLLGDKSKFDILLFVKEEPSYGTEIAQHFGLTTATVSHHMNQLLASRLVDVEIREKRVYYRTRKEEMQKIFEDCKNLFE